jgi:hypothetical protein
VRDQKGRGAVQCSVCPELEQILDRRGDGNSIRQPWRLDVGRGGLQEQGNRRQKRHEEGDPYLRP